MAYGIPAGTKIFDFVLPPDAADARMGKDIIQVATRRTQVGLRSIELSFPMYVGLMPPLLPLVECHACFHYVRLAWEQYRVHTENADNYVVRAGDEWKAIPTIDYPAIFKSVAFLYGVEEAHMSNAWPNVVEVAKHFKLGAVPEMIKIEHSIVLHS